MTEFQFIATDSMSAYQAIKKIDNKFKANLQAQKILFREIKLVRLMGDEALYNCEFVFPFPNLLIPAYFLTAITVIISLFYFRWWLFIPNFVLFYVAYLIKYMMSNRYYFKILKKGMIKNGYNGKLLRV